MLIEVSNPYENKEGINADCRKAEKMQIHNEGSRSGIIALLKHLDEKCEKHNHRFADCCGMADCEYAEDHYSEHRYLCPECIEELKKEYL